MPDSAMAEEFLHDGRIVNDGDPTPACAAPLFPGGATGRHRVLANGAAKGGNVPNALDEVAPFLGGQFQGRGRCQAGPVGDQFPKTNGSHFNI